MNNNIKDTFLRIFPTLKCNYNCDYCSINYKESNTKYKEIPVKDWLKFLNETDFSNRLVDDFNMIITGGEPTLYKDFVELINGINHKVVIIYTNLSHKAFLELMKLDKKVYISPTFHSVQEYKRLEEAALKSWLDRLLKLKSHGHIVHNPHVPNTGAEYLKKLPNYILKTNIEGVHNGVYHNPYVNECRIDKKETRQVKCMTTEFVIAPTGDIYNCQGGMFSLNKEQTNQTYLGNIKDIDIDKIGHFIDCDWCGYCHLCSRGKIIVNKDMSHITDKWQYVTLMNENNEQFKWYPTNPDLRGKFNE